MAGNTSQSNSSSDASLSDFFRELAKVQDNQRSLVIVTQGYTELLLNAVIDAKCKNGKRKITSNNRDYPYSVKLVLLNELGLIDDRLYSILDWFRKLRNRAAHEAFFHLTAGDINFANRSMDRFLRGDVNPIVHNLDRFCQLLVGTIWNRHLDVLVQIFEPEINCQDEA